MAEFTENYGLEKPDQNEFYNVDVQNQNMDKIDQAIAEAGNNPQLEINVAEIKDKIGAPNDAGSSSTTSTTVGIFAKLNYLVSQVSSYLSNIHARIGVPTDTANSATSASAHGKLNWFLNLFGTTDDTGATVATGTVMGKLNRLMEDNKYLSTKKLFKTVNANVTGDIVLDVSGAGEFYYAKAQYLNQIIVEVDGEQYYTNPSNDNNVYFNKMGFGLNYVPASMSSGPPIIAFPFHFKNSLKIIVDMGTSNNGVTVSYGLYE